MPSFLDMLQDPNVLLTFDKVQNPLRLPCGTTSERPRVLRTRQFLHFWLRYVLRATMACTFSTFQLQKVVRDHQSLTLLTSKCASRHNGVIFSPLIWPDGSAPAALASLLFDPPEPQIIGKTWWIATFLSFRAPASSFFWLFLLTLFLLWSSLFFSSLSLTLPTSPFPSVHVVGSLTSKNFDHNTFSTNTVVITCVIIYSTIAATITTIKSQPLALLFCLDSIPLHSDVGCLRTCTSCVALCTRRLRHFASTLCFARQRPEQLRRLHTLHRSHGRRLHEVSIRSP